MTNKNAILFIPDISGFTQFVNETAQEHSQHIIQELLEVIIDIGSSYFEVAEIEGDAVFFYKMSIQPDLALVQKIAEDMFVAFHQHLLLYEHQRVCNCGACSGAVKLSLKIIAHFGNINFIKVKDTRKPFGDTVILAHRLLKNEIESQEYLLLTDSFEKVQSANNPQLTVHEGSTSYETYGEVNYQYINLSTLKQDLPIPNKRKLMKNGTPARIERVLPCSINEVYRLISDLNERRKWQSGVDDLIFNDKEINRVGSKHICVINGKHLQFETIDRNFKNESMVFGEKTSTIPMFKEANTYYFLEKISENKTKIIVEVYAVPYPFIGKLFLPAFRKFTSIQLGKVLDDLLQYCVQLETKPSKSNTENIEFG